MFGAWLALAAEPRAPGVVVVPEALGRDEDLAVQCQHWASQGFHALGPDLSWRLPATAASAAMAPSAPDVDIDQGVNDLQIAIDWLRHLDGPPRPVGCVGHGLGGLLSVRAAVYGRLDAAVAYAPLGIERHLDEIPALACPVLIHLNESDPRLPAATQTRLARLLSARADAACHRYPALASRRSSEPASAAPDPASAHDHGAAAATVLAQTRSLDFLHRHLRSGNT